MRRAETYAAILLIITDFYFLKLLQIPDWVNIVRLPSFYPAATVSRTGIVFLEPRRLGWKPVVTSWLQSLPRVLADHTPHLCSLLDWLLPPLLHFSQQKMKHLTPVGELSMVGSLLRLLDALLDKPFGRRIICGKPSGYGQGAVAPRSEAAVASSAADEAAEAEARATNSNLPTTADVSTILEGFTVMAIVWSLGAVADGPGRTAFSSFLRALLSGKAASHSDFVDFHIKNPSYSSHFADSAAAAATITKSAGVDTSSFPLRSSPVCPPEEGSVYDYCFGSTTSTSKGDACYGWRHWTAGVTPFKIPDGASFSSIIVPTIDTVRNEHLLDLLIRHQRHVLAVGDTGTGKSASIMQKLLGGSLGGEYQPVFMAFSARTTAGATQDLVDSKLSRRRKGVYGPPLGQRAVIFVDDLNMPAKEKFGAQPPVEVQSQLIDDGGWYDRRDKDRSFMEVNDCQFVAAMGLPGGGRSVITARYVRHFNVIGYIPSDDASLVKIFDAIVAWSTAAAPSAVKAMAPSVVSTTVGLYSRIARELLPTPAKSHYTYNLRDLAKVFQGMHMADVSKISDVNAYLRLWGNECHRTFADRLINDEDRAWFTSALSSAVKDSFKKDWAKDVCGGQTMPLYGSLDAGSSAYMELADREKVRVLRHANSLLLCYYR